MREIKFRGRRVDNGKWVYGFYAKRVYVEPGSPATVFHYIVVPDRHNESWNFYEVYPKVLQFTGFRDKHGKDIYEGDIVEVKDRRYELHGIGIVEWDKENGLWMIYFPDTQGATMLRDWLPKEYEASLSIEVIGNVYENPELLEEE